MRGIGFDLQGNKGEFDKCSSFETKFKKEGNLSAVNEPSFVLDTRGSTSPSTSTSTLSSSFGGGGNGSSGGGGGHHNSSSNLVLISDNTMNHNWPAPENEPEGGGQKDEWAAELQPICGAENPQRFVSGIGMEDWEKWLSESAAQDQHVLRWVSGDVDDTPSSLKQQLHAQNSNEIEKNSNLEPWGDSVNDFSSNLNPSSGVPNSCFSSTLAPNSRVLNSNPNSQNPNLPLPHHQFVSQNTSNINISSLLPDSNYTQKDQHQFEPQMKRHNYNLGLTNIGVNQTPFLDEFLLSKHQPQMGFGVSLNSLPPNQFVQKSFIAPAGGIHEQISVTSHLHQQQQQQVIYDQLYKATELVLSANFSHAQTILARLNHQLSINTKPFQRAAFYFKEALQMSLLMISNTVDPIPSKVPTPVDGLFKIGAYKVLSEISPIIQFMNLTSNQALLEAVGNANSIHIVDFDIGFGAQWSSFLQELPRRDRGPPSLKITAFASPSTHHQIELGLMHESLTLLATKIGVSFELEVVNFDTFNPNSYLVLPQSSENEVIAVNFPISSTFGHLHILPSLLSFIKQLSPKIIVSMDRGCERIDLPYPQHLLHTLQYYEILLDSFDAANATCDTINKIERFYCQPKVEGMVLGRLHFPDQMPHWKSLFDSMGFLPVAFSSFTETQAEYLVKNTQVRGFHVEKHQSSLVLYWQHRELMSISTWRC